MNLQTLLPEVLSIARLASQKILEIYQNTDSNFKIQHKTDNSPLTIADLASNQIITEGLKQLTPNYPVLSEESPAISYQERSGWQRYWLIDPLDGTKEFIQRTDEFTINIALIENHQAILGIIFAPVLDLGYFAIQGHGAFKQQGKDHPTPIHTHKIDLNAITIVSSRRHSMTKLQSFLDQLPNYNLIHKGSALKCCIVAEGTADIYPRLGPTSEWDIAAGQCILKEAGGAIVDLQGNVLQYNTKESLINPPFVAIGDRTYFQNQFPIVII